MGRRSSRTFSQYARRQIYWSWRRRRDKRLKWEQASREQNPVLGLVHAVFQFLKFYFVLGIFGWFFFGIDSYFIADIIVLIALAPPAVLIYCYLKKAGLDREHEAQMAKLRSEREARLLNDARKDIEQRHDARQASLDSLELKHLAQFVGIFPTASKRDFLNVVNMFEQHRMPGLNSDFLLSLYADDYSKVCRFLAAQDVFRGVELAEFRDNVSIPPDVTRYAQAAGRRERLQSPYYLQNYLLRTYPLISYDEQDAAWGLTMLREQVLNRENLESSLFALRAEIRSANLPER